MGHSGKVESARKCGNPLQSESRRETFDEVNSQEADASRTLLCSGSRCLEIFAQRKEE